MHVFPRSQAGQESREPTQGDSVPGVKSVVCISSDSGGGRLSLTLFPLKILTIWDLNPRALSELFVLTFNPIQQTLVKESMMCKVGTVLFS